MCLGTLESYFFSSLQTDIDWEAIAEMSLFVILHPDSVKISFL